MAEICLTMALAVLAFFWYLTERAHERERQVWTEERKTLLNRVMARTPIEAVRMDEPFVYHRVEREIPDGFEGQVGL